MKVVTTEYGNIKEILKYPDHHVGKAIMVSDTGVSADSYGRKIVPAGTILGSSSGEYQKSNDENAEGVLLYDTDVTYGEAPASMIIHGFINLDKIPEAPTDEAKEVLRMIQFL